MVAGDRDPLVDRFGDVARNLHATGGESGQAATESKKNAEVASSTFLRNSSHVSPSVKMLSVRHSAQYPPPDSWTTHEEERKAAHGLLSERHDGRVRRRRRGWSSGPSAWKFRWSRSGW